MLRLLVALGIVVFATSCPAAEPPQMTFPGRVWEEASPESEGIDSSKLREAVAFLEKKTGRDGVKELVIVRRGRLIWRGPDIDKVHGVWSCTKSFTSTVLGLLIEDGKCALDTPAMKAVPALATLYPNVTLRHFTTMTSGYRAAGDRPELSHGQSPTPLVPDQPLFAPGEKYAYWDSAMNQFGQVLTRIAGEPIEELLKRRIADPIQMDRSKWKWGQLTTIDGLAVNGGSGNMNKQMEISARELARFGHLFLNRGNWNGKQLISAAWVDEAAKVQVPASLPWGHRVGDIEGCGVYGFNWWANGLKADGTRKWPGAPLGTYGASGHNNNRMFVVPEWNLVVVRLGLDQADGKVPDEVWSGFLEKVGQARSEAAQQPVAAPVSPRSADGGGGVEVTGELKQWHKVTLTLDGPFARERDDRPNPFTDYRMTVRFTHESGSPSYQVPGYFAADGTAANTSADAGTKWRAHLSPDKVGKWAYVVSFVEGRGAALDAKAAGQKLAKFDGRSGTFEVAGSDKTGRDFRGRGRLQYVGKHHLRFVGSGEFFLKAGPDAPETLLAFADFDGTVATRKNGPLKTWQPHLRDWRSGDPTWKGGKGKGLIGALNYLAAKGCNAFSFLTYNAGGDGDNVWPFIARDDKLHYDCSKLDQWQTVFDHAQALGLYLHFKMQETEMDDNREGDKPARVPTALDGGDLGPERKLYCRELIARFGHELALNWNLGEENTQSPEQQRAMAQYLRDVDPYGHLIVVHTFPDWQDRVYSKLLGNRSALTGASLQNGWSDAHRRTLKWVAESAKAGKPWVVANDEQNPPGLGVPPDPGYLGFSGKSIEGKAAPYDLHDIRKATLWGTLMAGGAGVEYYFGYSFPQHDLVCEDFRSRDKSWDYCRIALEFFRDNKVPFAEMANADALVGNATGDNSKYCFAKLGEIYVVYLSRGGTTELDLSKTEGTYQVAWFDPRSGGPLQEGSVRQVTGGRRASLGNPPATPQEDWVVLVKK